MHAQERGKPNIVIIMADDLASNELSCYGGKNLKTPHIDALAEEGLKFKQVYASEAMCVPLRASLFTGLYPARHGSFQNHKPVLSNLKSIGHYLGDLGYRVALTGKDHSTRPRTVFPFEIIQGFETNCVANSADYTLDSLRRFVSTSQKPFCLFVMSINPHIPWTVGDPSEFDSEKLILPPNWIDTKETRQQYTKYLAEIRQLDNEVGDVRRMLKDTGQDKNTMVVFLGEQGPQFPGGKWTLWDHGQKSAMIVKHSGKVKAGSQTDALVQYEDITPTLVALAGGKAIQGLDGSSFLNVIEGQSDKHRQYAYSLHNNIPEGPSYPMRSIRDSQYKLILNLTPEAKYHIKYMMTPGRNTVIWDTWQKEARHSERAKFLIERVTDRPAVEFYDTRKDPWELNNLAQDPAYAGTIKMFTAELQKWMQQQGDEGAAMDKVYTQQNEQRKRK
ncbi:sulfatase [Pontibacter sp. SGAir0037]|uniref:sulfatase family protein n=1 Tax=Pontibacter sp. SGAir0037 TaxID=2571030 RepID=UPI001F0DFF71|nr:sulfatase [Pontibacter sp. SGAir0037]